MSSLLTQMRGLFPGRRRSPRPVPEATRGTPDSGKNHKVRDTLLEQRARKFVHPLVPALSEVLRVGWNFRMRTTAGVAIPLRWEIWLNHALKGISEEEVERTLLHELAHLVTSHRHPRRRLEPHGREWRQACSELGIAGEGRTHQLPFQVRRMKRRYRLRCPVCRESHERVRPPKGRVACLACCRRYHGGRYHERFRLEIVKIG